MDKEEPYCTACCLPINSGFGIEGRPGSFCFHCAMLAAADGAELITEWYGVPVDGHPEEGRP